LKWPFFPPVFFDFIALSILELSFNLICPFLLLDQNAFQSRREGDYQHTGLLMIDREAFE
jgi:hypothetical protein